LFVPDLDKDELFLAAKKSVEAGANGINFFNARSLMKGGKLEAVKKLNELYNTKK